MKIPVIPPGWHVKERTDELTTWCPPGKQDGIGHFSKRVVYLKCDLVEEVDDYFLTTLNREVRVLQITCEFNNKTRPNYTITYKYQAGNDANFITKLQADSIFKAERINADY